MSLDAMSGEESIYLEDLSRCVRCGGCKAFCPTYKEDPSESMSARGRLVLLHELVSGRMTPSKLMNDRMYDCILCGACSATCPRGIDITEAIYRGRALLSSNDKGRRYSRALVKFATKWPDLTFKMARTSRNFLLSALVRRRVIPFMPELPEIPLRRTDQVFKVPRKKGRIAVFTGCSINFIFPHLGESLIHVLQKLGYEVILPKGETCCGNPLRSLGLEKEAQEHAKRNFRVFSRLKVEAILSLCPTCTLTLKTEYANAIGRGLENAMDISVFLQDKLGMTESIGKSTVYHDPCHLRYGLGIRKEPRQIIKNAGIDLIEPADSGCCGFGGTFCLSFQDMSDKLLAGQTANLIGTKTDTVITSCPGCMLQLSRTISDRPVIHLIELIEEAYCFRTVEKAARKEKDTKKELTLF
jgi:glycolate oxidase iron-sulfur subunit